MILNSFNNENNSIPSGFCRQLHMPADTSTAAAAAILVAAAAQWGFAHPHAFGTYAVDISHFMK